MTFATVEAFPHLPTTTEGAMAVVTAVVVLIFLQVRLRVWIPAIIGASNASGNSIPGVCKDATCQNACCSCCWAKDWFFTRWAFPLSWTTRGSTLDVLIYVGEGQCLPSRKCVEWSLESCLRTRVCKSLRLESKF